VLAKFKEQFANRALLLVRTRLMEKPQGLTGALTPLAKATGTVVGLEFAGQAACEVAGKSLSELTADKKNFEIYVTPDPTTAVQMGEAFFKEIKV